MTLNDIPDKKANRFFLALGSVFSMFVLLNLSGLIYIDLWTFQAIILLVLFSLEYLPDMFQARKDIKKLVVPLVSYLLGALPSIYLIFEIPRLEWFYGTIWTTGDIIFGAMLILALLKLTHRKYGLPMPLIAGIFMLYVLFGHVLPADYFGHGGFSFSRSVSFMFGPSAIFGIVFNTFARIIFLYLLFGAFLEVSGVGQFLIDLSFAIAGKFRGGPAKVAIISSGLLGTINGNSVANVATTGAITIPLMKKVGYKPYFAGAVEAVASTGGQILPPVMGAGAFIMAEFLQKSYYDIAIAAAIPAILYYMAIFLMVDLEAIRLDLKGVDPKELPRLRDVMKKSYLLIPIFVLIYELIIVRASVTYSGVVAIICTVVVSWFGKDTRMGIRKIIQALYNGAKDSISIMATCATAGIIVGAVSMTGLGTRFSSVVLAVARGNLPLLALFTSLICIILGMGLPTTASYVITVAVAAPSLIKAGVAPLAAHMFVFYYACLSAITPPVAGASYTGASIAQAPIMKTGITAVKLGIVAYVVPFFFLTNTSLIANGPVLVILRSFVTASIGIVLLAISILGINYNGRKVGVIRRIMFGAAFLLLVNPSASTDIYGGIIAVLAFITDKTYFENMVKYFKRPVGKDDR